MRKHPIKEFCDKTGTSQVALARQIGCSPQLISELVAGRCSVSRKTALSLVRATGGEVTLASLLTWEPSEEGTTAA